MSTTDPAREPSDSASEPASRPADSPPESGSESAAGQPGPLAQQPAPATGEPETDNTAQPWTGAWPARQEEPPAPPAVPARSFRTRKDLVAVAVLVVAVLVSGVLVWRYSDAAATTSEPASGSFAVPSAPKSLPPSLGESWRTPSGATGEPVVAGPNVIAGNGSEVTGRDPLTGDVRWRYSRDLPLCTVGTAWSLALAVYHKDINCSEVTALDQSSGKRGPQRNGEAQLGTRLISDGTHVAAFGKTYFEVWRSDLVRTLEYGQVRGIVNPNKQPRTGCSYGSIAAGITANRFALIERCPDDLGDRLTVVKSNPKDFDSPEVVVNTVLSGKGGRVVAVSADRVVAALPAPARLVIYDNNGSLQAEVPLNVPDADLQEDPDGGITPTTVLMNARCYDNTITPLTMAPSVSCPDGQTVSTAPAYIYWFTGSKTVALAANTLAPLWTYEGTLGAGTLFTNRLLLPVKGGLAVVDPVTGGRFATYSVDRQDYTGPVAVATAGPVVLEQRGGTLVALR